MGAEFSRSKVYTGVFVCSVVVPIALLSKSRAAYNSTRHQAKCSHIPVSPNQPVRPEITAVLDFLLPFLGPEVGTAMQVVSNDFAASFSAGAIRAMSQTKVWQSFFLAFAQPLVELMQASAELSVIQRAACLGRFLPDGLMDVWTPDSNGRPPLVKAAAKTHRRIPLFQTLLAARASPNCSDQYGWTPLMWASHGGDANACDVLLRAKADVNHVTQAGDTALICATQARNQLRVFEVLLAAGANPAIVPTQGACADHWEEGALDLLFSACRKVPLAKKSHVS